MTDLKKEGYKPQADFEEDVKDPLIDVSSLMGSKEFWLIQWPIGQLQPRDINGKGITLRLNKDGDIGSFESASGKTFDLVSYASQEPDVTVIVAAGSESKMVGKVSRRVCLVHYPEPSEMEKPSPRRSASSYGSKSSPLNTPRSMSSMPRTPVTSSKHRSSSVLYGTSHDTLTSAYTLDQSMDVKKHSKHKRAREHSPTPTEQTSKFTGRSSQGSRPESHVSKTSSGFALSEKSHGSTSKDKKKKVEM